MPESAIEESRNEVFHTEDYDRSLKEYETQLHFSRNDLRGKTVLDIGSGKNLRFAREAAKEGIHVISVNPELGTDASMRKGLIKPWFKRILQVGDSQKRFSKQIEKETVLRTIAAKAQNLPLADESVDAILGLYSATSYIGSPEEMKIAFNEIKRVLKPEGEARFKHFRNKMEMITPIVDILKTQGYLVEQQTDLEWDTKSLETGTPSKFEYLKMA